MPAPVPTASRSRVALLAPLGLLLLALGLSACGDKAPDGTQPVSDDAKKNQELLEEALAEQQRENRKQLEQMLKETGRFTENDLGYTFRLTPSEIEWLLQVLNDIRVGSWIQLGEPDPKGEMSQPLNEQTMILAWTMEIAGLFQNSLLEAAHSAD